MSDKVAIPKYKPRMGKLAGTNLPPTSSTPFIKLRLGLLASFTEEILHGNGMAVSSGKGGNGAETRPSSQEWQRKGKKEHDIAAFIKLNVSFPDTAFPEGTTLLSDQLPSHPFFPSWKADRVGSLLTFLYNFTPRCPPLALILLSLNCIFV